MAKSRKADYTSAKALFLTGLPLPQVAEKTGINYGALRQHARRQNWLQDKDGVDTKIQESVAECIKDAAESHIRRATGIDARILAAIERKRIESMELDELEQCATILAKVNPVARVNRGMDDESKRTFNVGLVLPVVEIRMTEPKQEEKPAQVVDVQTVEPEQQ